MRSEDSLPGAIAISYLLMIIGIIVALSSLGASGAVQGLLAGFGPSMFLAGFLGYVNARILSREVERVVRPVYEDLAFLIKMRGCGLRDVSRVRSDLTRGMKESIQSENKELVVVGSSLKGLIGVGYKAEGEPAQIRELLFDALKRGVHVNMLLTSPNVAHYRSKQEGRSEDDIPAEILANLMYLVKLKRDNPKFKLTIKLYYGTPTIFMLCTQQLMMINPYPYYSTAYGSFSFLIDGESPLYRTYYSSHYREAWNALRSTVPIDENIEDAKTQLRLIIEDKSIISSQDRKSELLDMLDKIK